MQALLDLVQQARAEAEAEVARELQICNACRYCEGFCAVFPAMTRHLEFGKADINYLANLCHNCGACYHACQYAPPHEFAVNVPRAMAAVPDQPSPLPSFAAVIVAAGQGLRAGGEVPKQFARWRGRPVAPAAHRTRCCSRCH